MGEFPHYMHFYEIQNWAASDEVYGNKRRSVYKRGSASGYGCGLGTDNYSFGRGYGTGIGTDEGSGVAGRGFGRGWCPGSGTGVETGDSCT